MRLYDLWSILPLKLFEMQVKFNVDIYGNIDKDIVRSGIARFLGTKLTFHICESTINTEC
jgi:hypothetical protein